MKRLSIAAFRRTEYIDLGPSSGKLRLHIMLFDPTLYDPKAPDIRWEPSETAPFCSNVHRRVKQRNGRRIYGYDSKPRSVYRVTERFREIRVYFQGKTCHE